MQILQPSPSISVFGADRRTSDIVNGHGNDADAPPPSALVRRMFLNGTGASSHLQRHEVQHLQTRRDREASSSRASAVEANISDDRGRRVLLSNTKSAETDSIMASLRVEVEELKEKVLHIQAFYL